jgi:hypothetical protein
MSPQKTTAANLGYSLFVGMHLPFAVDVLEKSLKHLRMAKLL